MSSESDKVSPTLNIEKCSLVLVDVAGTTTSINFVKETLFPFVTKQVDSFLQSKWEEDSVKECIKDLKETEADLDTAAAIDLVKTLTQKESDNKGLKALQGLIYKQGYESGELKAHVFDDVPEAFETWAKSRHIAIYSTGSVESQQLLFTHSTVGDLSGHIYKYFDQNSIGPKTEADSFKKIAKESEVEPEEIVFITDSADEAKAGKSAGVQAVLITREGNPSFDDAVSKEFTVIGSFKELSVEKAAKRKIDEAPAPSEAPPAKILKTDSEETTSTEETIEKEEAMEVDASAESEKKPEPATTEETKTATETEETQNKDTTEKTESGEASKETESESMEVAEPEATKPTEESSEDQHTEKKESSTEETPKSTAETAVETVTTTEIDKKPEEKTAKVEASTENGEKSEAVAEVTEDKVDSVESKQVVDEKSEDAVEKAVDNAETKEATADSAKEDNKEEESSVAKIEEKENKSVLANGVENGNKGEDEVKESEIVDSKIEEVDSSKSEENEVKVKKLEESAESKTVSVEV